MNAQDWYIILNPFAGSGKTIRKWPAMKSRLEARNINFIVRETDMSKTISDLAYDGASQGYRKFLAVGGDGSVHEAFNGLMSYCDSSESKPEEFYLGVIPIGSGNDWLKSLNLSSEINAVADMLADPTFVSQDIVRVQTMIQGKPSVCYMLNIGGAGFDSSICQIVNAQKKSGQRRTMMYFRALTETLPHIRPFPVKISADGQALYSGDIFSLAVGTGRFSGGGMRQVPLARIDDGLTDMVIIPRTRLFNLIPQIPRLFTGSLNKCRFVQYGQYRTIRIEPLDARASAIHFEADGEIKGTLPVDLEVTGQCINVLSAPISCCD